MRSEKTGILSRMELLYLTTPLLKRDISTFFKEHSIMLMVHTRIVSSDL